MNISRRGFIGTVASAAVAAGPVSQKLTPFPYGATELLDGPLKRQFDENHSFFLGLSEDRLLKIYRQRAGLPAPGEYMGGWYEGFSPGAHFGQYVSALARFAASTGSQPTKAKVQRLIRGYSQTIDPSGKFFVDLRFPSYTYDKLTCMLIDAHSLLGEPDAAAILRATLNAALPHMPDHAMTREEQKAWRPYLDETHTWDEPYTVAENQFLAYERLGDRRYYDLGRRYLQDRVFFDPLSRGENVLPGLHAYSHMNSLSSGMQGYLKLGDPKYLQAVSNAVDMIWTTQSFATGGWGPNESFVEPGKGLLGASLKTTHRSFETPCGAYAHFKVMRYLLGVTQDMRYGDSMEQVLYNTVLGAKPICEDGRTFYYSDYGVPGQKIYKRDIKEARWSWDHDGRWPCCSGTLPQMAADYTISTYFRSPNGIYVNLFVPSRIRWTTGSTRYSLAQETSYPTANLVRLTLNASKPSDMVVYLRVPAWAGANTSVSINGKRRPGAVAAGQFLALGRTWNDGDQIEYDIDQRVSSVPVDAQTPDQVAIKRGAQVLFAISDTGVVLSPKTAGNPPIRPTQGVDWQLEDSPVPLRPFYAIGNEQYQTYWSVKA